MEQIKKLKINGKEYEIKGEKGDPYTLTDEDKKEIVDEVLSHFTDVSEYWQNTITFTINGTEYKAVAGQTWTEWCEENPEYGYKCYQLEGTVCGLGGLGDLVSWVDPEMDAEMVVTSSDVIGEIAYYSWDPVSPATITINGFGECHVMHNMSWYDWCNSKYNIYGFQCYKEDSPVMTVDNYTMHDGLDNTVWGDHRINSYETYYVNEE